MPVRLSREEGSRAVSAAIRLTKRREVPLIFSEESIPGLLDGSKTQTRRTLSRTACLVNGVQATKEGWAELDFAKAWVDPGPSPAGNRGPYLKVPTKDGDCVHRVYPRLQPGDLVWVKERYLFIDKAARKVDYAATTEDGPGHFLTPLFMPRWASRVTLEISSVVPQRLHDITEEDAKAEGVGAEFEVDAADFVHGRKLPASTHVLGFKHRWRDLNDERAPWASNPIVWVISFRRIDARMKEND